MCGSNCKLVKQLVYFRLNAKCSRKSFKLGTPSDFVLDPSQVGLGCMYEGGGSDRR
jgi:hypothetical protein